MWTRNTLMLKVNDIWSIFSSLQYLEFDHQKGQSEWVLCPWVLRCVAYMRVSKWKGMQVMKISKKHTESRLCFGTQVRTLSRRTLLLELRSVVSFEQSFVAMKGVLRLEESLLQQIKTNIAKKKRRQSSKPSKTPMRFWVTNMREHGNAHTHSMAIDMLPSLDFLKNCFVCGHTCVWPGSRLGWSSGKLKRKTTNILLLTRVIVCPG